MGKDLKGKDLGKGISQRKDGTYVARHTNRFGQRKSYYGKKVSEVKKQLGDAIYEDAHGINGDGKNITLDEWFGQWVETYKKGIVSDKTINKNRSYYNARIKDKLGKMYLKNIKLTHIQKLVNELFQMGLSHGTVSNIKTLLSEVLKKAVANDYILKNPCEGIVMPRKPKKEKQVLSLEEQEKFFTVAGDYLHINVLKFAIATGCRIGEILGLKWDDINFAKQTITIRRNLNYSKACSPYEDTNFYFDSPKTESSMRTFHMTEEVETILKSQKRKQMENRLKRGYGWTKREEWLDLIFTCLDGKPVYYSNVNQSLKDYVELINLVEIESAKKEDREVELFQEFTCHTLRHTFATRCYEAGIDEKVLQKIMGHSSLSMTDHYTHVTDEKATQELSKIRILA